MSMEMSEVMRAVVRLQVLNSEKTGLALEIAEKFALNRRSEMTLESLTHMRDDHAMPVNVESSRSDLIQYEQELRQLRAQYDGVCAQIDQIFADMKAKNYDPFA
jgi:hypothetical protein